MKKLIYILMAAASFTACEDVIELDIEDGKTFPVVDAWITTDLGKQSIRITQTVPYTSQAPAPVITDAVITLYDLTDGGVYPFTYADGAYSYDPGGTGSIGIIGHAYKLRVEIKGEVFEAIDTIKRVPVLDSISYEYKTEEEAQSGEAGYYAKLHGKDIGGATDYYWIRSWRNDRSKLVGDGFAVDGAFDEGQADGYNFIPPVAESITRWDKPFQTNETVIVRIASCTKQSFTFLTHVNEQVNMGGLFAKVLENVQSNLKNTNASSQTRVLGWFGVSSTNYIQKTVR